MTQHAQDSLGLWPEPLPPMPHMLEGYEREDLVWIWEGQRRIKGRVIAVLRHSHTLTIRTEDDRIISINPVLQPASVCKRSNT